MYQKCTTKPEIVLHFLGISLMCPHTVLPTYPYRAQGSRWPRLGHSGPCHGQRLLRPKLDHSDPHRGQRLRWPKVGHNDPFKFNGHCDWNWVMMTHIESRSHHPILGHCDLWPWYEYVDTMVCGDNGVWTEWCMDTMVRRHIGFLLLGTMVCGHSDTWAERHVFRYFHWCVGTLVYGGMLVQRYMGTMVSAT